MNMKRFFHANGRVKWFAFAALFGTALSLQAQDLMMQQQKPAIGIQPKAGQQLEAVKQAPKVKLPDKGRQGATPIEIPYPIPLQEPRAKLPDQGPQAPKPDNLSNLREVPRDAPVARLPDAGRQGATPIEIPYPIPWQQERVNLPDPDRQGATPIEIPYPIPWQSAPEPGHGTGQVSSLPLPIPEPELNAIGAGNRAGPAPGTGPVSGLPIPLSGPQARQGLGTDAVSGMPIPIEDTGQPTGLDPVGTRGTMPVPLPRPQSETDLDALMGTLEAPPAIE